jgi:hypothetical protein
MFALPPYCLNYPGVLFKQRSLKCKVFAGTSFQDPTVGGDIVGLKSQVLRSSMFCIAECKYYRKIEF